MSFIRTILGDIPTDEIGVTFSHEHVMIDESYVTFQNPDFLLNDIDKISQELVGLKELGCSLMVDAMPANAGRNAAKMADISQRTGVHLIGCTGMHQEIYYPASHWRYQYSEDQLTDLFIADIQTGIDTFDYNGPVINRSEFKAGLLKLATGDEPFTLHQQKIFRAVVNAHRETGAPILTHTTNGNQALEQALLFDKLGADLNHVVLSHTDRNKDLGYHLELMQTGVSVEYDSAFRWKNDQENWTYWLLEKLLFAYPNQITVGMDAARNTYWKSYDGKPGLDYLLTNFVEGLTERGLHPFFNKLFIENPQRIFSFKEQKNAYM
ncbi:phosphotriesterase family protein [Arundinibacter roseus]|uniref:Aryldialkylphosphatase n=1 Tax=Arundinibacter roseus TaxID=2070510 RepID=A0A4R4KKB5_9BACT|nr:aryldialkylphosphatase [Arundinibacter roseus]TDB67376.1 aryldialkylphosphatase [Arundinibacter roseus]